ncbi:bifunctional heparan sulfate N-deacetylase/N-sulfotransferase-like [Amphibalanus amphitrite]|uniref:bifunctional heparan sulfate N-deacetylase/N-sulfotransferase-like n=1 Tax=Amphibalanus amphitrite TaxID=1232801 RepID=UPI001C92562D|nr:bifunctional heparan sulfate N-deacetylase/N-sulfotransferase-like [Amphibalanus amphitrite]XP_043198897.1 bifunctional heparan sulfate N-deacetylase/N-sulfotransferase-like [Amphibalanus amphitrite]XP_043198898.1 bifunctional heparan sulfate N-deacetylase/N-sulfotransferase-like [Amphibalanus amphitrite]
MLLCKTLLRKGRHCCGLRLLRCAVTIVAVVALVMVLYSAYYLGQAHVIQAMHHQPPTVRVTCGAPPANGAASADDDARHRSAARLRLEPKVLLFLESQYSARAKELSTLLTASGIRYKIVTSAALPTFTAGGRGRYGALLFESYERYLAMDAWSRAIVDRYCTDFDVGIAAFMPAREESLHGATLPGSALRIHTNLALRDARLDPESPVLRMARAGETLWGAVPGEAHTVFVHNHTSYRPVMMAELGGPELAAGRLQGAPLTVVVQDCGYHDGIRRVLFGVSPMFWLSKLLLLDALSYLSHGRLAGDLERRILVDVDDIFVGKAGTRMKPADVEAMLASQERLRSLVPGFTFNLGFCGKMLHSGTDEEDAGDDALLAAADKFWWFPHIWSHKQPHTFANRTAIAEQMALNKAFSAKHGIPVLHQYAVAPHHSGVYPVSDQLYEAWREVWDVRQTSTEEYPHLYPAGQRRGFVYRDVRVLPRQTCGLFTHTIMIDEYPGGRQVLEDKIRGGELFQTIVTNAISVFMTHLSNYGNDRLALYAFESVVRFVQCWTRLRLQTEPPDRLADLYFQRFPEQRDPVWGNPCKDQRHLNLWRLAGNASVCDRFPKLLILGPQKTGSTALLSFLSLHPTLRASLPSPQTFEEVQFFNGDNYLRGIDWYLEFFPVPNSDSSVYLFEKSATYFDGDAVPKRVFALLPKAKLVVILLSPAARAYSWYQHQRAHGLTVALEHSFLEVITATNQSARALRQLRNRCLEPGKYAAHLEAWLRYFPAEQLHLTDGERLRTDPVTELHRLQDFIQVSPRVNFTKLITYDAEKGFYCQRVPSGSGGGSRTRCLGGGKGRKYDPMSDDEERVLKKYFFIFNQRLSKLLKRIGKPVPDWLVRELTDVPATG